MKNIPQYPITLSQSEFLNNAAPVHNQNGLCFTELNMILYSLFLKRKEGRKEGGKKNKPTLEKVFPFQFFLNIWWLYYISVSESLAEWIVIKTIRKKWEMKFIFKYQPLCMSFGAVHSSCWSNCVLKVWIPHDILWLFSWPVHSAHLTTAANRSSHPTTVNVFLFPSGVHLYIYNF